MYIDIKNYFEVGNQIIVNWFGDLKMILNLPAFTWVLILMARL